jgi:flavin-dependent thymidylate synthase
MNMPDHQEITDRTKALEKYADASMFEAAPMQGREVSVHLLAMTPDPLGAIAAACMMYEGIPVYDLNDVTDEQRQHYAAQVQATHLKAPLEFVKFHFMIEGVDRAFTHQMVRQRTAVFAQESLRFAVKDNFATEATLPPSLAALPAHHPNRQKWDEHMQEVENFYNFLIGNGIPAEDARAMLPHNVSTRLHYATDLRNLSDHAGNRLCTQAQFVWRDVFTKIVDAIRNYSFEGEELVKLPLFKPVCYQMGHCPFKADFDRGCTIRERVDAGKFDEIQDSEWMADARAAWQ